MDIKTHTHMSPDDFAKYLIITEELDPVYSALYRGTDIFDYSHGQLDKLLVAYFCLYHLGAAARIAERAGSDKAFWRLIMEAAVNTGLKWPRGSERRHWRGAQAVASAQHLVDLRMSPTALLDDWAAGATFAGVSSRVRECRGFGPWIAFKVADVLERVRGNPIDFADCELGFYDEPRKGAQYMLEGGVPVGEPLDDAQFQFEVSTWTKRLVKKGFKAPPDFQRPVNVQEIETIFCKYKSHVNGHYPLGKDTLEVQHGLTGWGDLATAIQAEVSKLPNALKS